MSMPFTKAASSRRRTATACSARRSPSAARSSSWRRTTSMAAASSACAASAAFSAARSSPSSSRSAASASANSRRHSPCSARRAVKSGGSTTGPSLPVRAAGRRGTLPQPRPCPFSRPYGPLRGVLGLFGRTQRQSSTAAGRLSRRHQWAAEAHHSAMAAPLDETVAGAAMRNASERVGVRPHAVAGDGRRRAGRSSL